VSGPKLVMANSLIPASGAPSSRILTMDKSGPAHRRSWRLSTDYSTVTFSRIASSSTPSMRFRGLPIHFAYETHIIGVDGTVLQPLLTGSEFIGTCRGRG